jgi:hypothetical protein
MPLRQIVLDKPQWLQLSEGETGATSYPRSAICRIPSCRPSNIRLLSEPHLTGLPKTPTRQIVDVIKSRTLVLTIDPA